LHGVKEIALSAAVSADDGVHAPHKGHILRRLVAERPEIRQTNLFDVHVGTVSVPQWTFERALVELLYRRYSRKARPAG